MFPCSLLGEVELVINAPLLGTLTLGTNTEQKKFLLQKALKLWVLTSYNIEVFQTQWKLGKLKPVSHRLSSLSFLKGPWTVLMEIYPTSFPSYTVMW